LFHHPSKQSTKPTQIKQTAESKCAPNNNN